VLRALAGVAVEMRDAIETGERQVQTERKSAKKNAAKLRQLEETLVEKQEQLSLIEKNLIDDIMKGCAPAQ